MSPAAVPTAAMDPRYALPLRFVTTPRSAADPAPQGGPGLLVLHLDGGRVREAADVFAALAQGLRYPGDFGGNWDALLDLLRDLSWLAPASGEGPPPGVVLCIAAAPLLWGRCYPIAAQLSEVWLQAALEIWLPQGVPFQVQFCSA